jgi:hypothetical protein
MWTLPARLDLSRSMAHPLVGAAVALLMAGPVLVGVGGCTSAGDEAEMGRTSTGRLVVGRVAADEPVTRAVAPGERTLVLRGYAGNVRLEGTPDDGTAQLTFTKRGRGDDQSEAQNALGGIDIGESGNAQQYVYDITARREARTSVDVGGTVPARTALRVQVGSGTVALTGITGRLEIDHVNGDVYAAGAGADVIATTRNGSITVGMAQLPDTATVRLRTSNGDITLALPPDAGTQVEAETDAGAVRTRLAFEPARLRATGAGTRFTGQIGEGGAQVELRTENGDIAIRRGPIETLGLPDSVAVETDDRIGAPDTTAPEGGAPPVTSDTTGGTAATPDTTATPSASDTTRTMPADTTAEEATPDTAAVVPTAADTTEGE